MSSDVETLVQMYRWPSEAYWRWFELQVLRSVAFERPVFEIGCGDGRFSQLLGIEVDVGVDLNPKGIAVAETLPNYRETACVDAARYAEWRPGEFGTVFANSVLEHIPGIEQIFIVARSLLRPGGELIATVPISAMNANLMFTGERYVAFRQSQLAHLNVWTLAEWTERLGRSGFTVARTETYLGPRQTRYWDSIDLPGTLGVGRWRVAPALTRALAALGLRPERGTKLNARVSEAFERRIPEPRESTDLHGSAALIVARRD